MTDASLARQPTTCPTCHADLQPTAGFVTWCPACGWNASPTRPEPEPDGRLARMELRLTKAAGTRLFEQLRGRSITAPTWTLSRVLALVVAGVVHAVTLALVGLGVFVLVRGWPNPFSIIEGVILLAIGWLLHPRLGRVDRKATALRRPDAPQLFTLLDTVSAGAGTHRVDLVVLDHNFNAAYSVVGLRRRRVVWLGLPLWAALAPQEKVALLGHEFGHGVNGDAGRAIFVHSAVSALAEWQHAFNTEEGGPILHLLLAPVRVAISGVVLLQFKLALYSSVRGEYLADAIGARLGSSDASLRCLDRSLSSESIMLGLRRAANRADAASTDMRTVVEDRVAAIPELEWERLRRAASARTHQVDSTHPPTRLRQELIESRSAEPGSITLTAAEVEAIDEEIAPYVPELQRRLYAELTYVH